MHSTSHDDERFADAANSRFKDGERDILERSDLRSALRKIVRSFSAIRRCSPDGRRKLRLLEARAGIAVSLLLFLTKRSTLTTSLKWYPVRLLDSLRDDKDRQSLDRDLSQFLRWLAWFSPESCRELGCWMVEACERHATSSAALTSFVPYFICNFASNLADLKHYALAERLCRSVLEYEAIQSRPDGSMLIAKAHARLGTVLLDQEHLDLANNACIAAGSVLCDAGYDAQEQNSQVADTFLLVGQLFQRLGMDNEALSYFEYADQVLRNGSEGRSELSFYADIEAVRACILCSLERLEWHDHAAALREDLDAIRDAISEMRLAESEALSALAQPLTPFPTSTDWQAHDPHALRDPGFVELDHLKEDLLAFLDVESHEFQHRYVDRAGFVVFTGEDMSHCVAEYPSSPVAHCDSNSPNVWVHDAIEDELDPALPSSWMTAELVSTVLEHYGLNELDESQLVVSLPTLRTLQRYICEYVSAYYVDPRVRSVVRTRVAKLYGLVIRACYSEWATQGHTPEPLCEWFEAAEACRARTSLEFRSIFPSPDSPPASISDVDLEENQRALFDTSIQKYAMEGLDIPAVARKHAGPAPTAKNHSDMLRLVDRNRVNLCAELEMLPCERAAIQYHITDVGGYALLLARGSVEAIRLPECSVARLAELHRTWNVALSKLSGSSDAALGMNDPLDRVMEEVSRIAIRPALESLPSGISSLIVAPHSYLHSFPISASFADDGSRLCERYDLTSIPSFALFAILRARPIADDKCLLSLDASDSSLRFRECETSQVAHHCSQWRQMRLDMVHIDAEQLCSAFETATVFHYAGHCVRDSTRDFMSSFAAGTGRGENRRITLRDILMHVRMPHVQLAVLSACESGAREPDGADEGLSFPTAFLCKGATRVIASLWPVEDMATALLVDRLFFNLRRGLTTSRALRYAQNWLRGFADDIGGGLVSGLAVREHFDRHEILAAVDDARVRRRCQKEIDELVDEWPDSPPFQSVSSWAGFQAYGLP
jgi:CHAT domain-containing protein